MGTESRDVAGAEDLFVLPCRYHTEPDGTSPLWWALGTLPGIGVIIWGGTQGWNTLPGAFTWAMVWMLVVTLIRVMVGQRRRRERPAPLHPGQILTCRKCKGPIYLSFEMCHYGERGPAHAGECPGPRERRRHD